MFRVGRFGEGAEGLGVGVWGASSLFLTLVTGPNRSLALKLSDTRVYKPQIRARLGTTAHFCKVSVQRPCGRCWVIRGKEHTRPFEGYPRVVVGACGSAFGMHLDVAAGLELERLVASDDNLRINTYIHAAMYTSMRMYIYMYIYIYTCTYICICIYIHIYTYIYI